MTDDVAFAATLIAEFVAAENERRGISVDGDRRALLALEATQVAQHLHDHGALAA